MEPMNEFINSKMEDMRMSSMKSAPHRLQACSKGYSTRRSGQRYADLVRTEIITSRLPQELADLETKIRKFDKDFNGW